MQVWFNETQTILSSDALKYYAEDTSEEYRTKVGKDVESTLTSLIQQNLDIFRKQQEIKERVHGLEREYLALTTAAGVNRKKHKDIESSILRCTSLTCPSSCPKYHSKDTLNQKDAARDEQFYFGLNVDVGIALTVSLKDIIHEPRILPIIRDFMCQNSMLETIFANKNAIRMGAMIRYRNKVWFFTPPGRESVCFVCLDSSKDDKERYRSINPLEPPQNIQDFGNVRKMYPNLTGNYNYTYCNIHEWCARKNGLVRVANMFPSDDMSKVLSLTKVENPPPKDLMEIKDKYVCSTRHDSVCTCNELSLIREAKERAKQQEFAAARKLSEAKELAKQQEFAAARKSHEQKGPAILKFYADNKLDLLTKNINCKTCKRMKRTNLEYILIRLPDQYDGGYQRRLCFHSRVDKILLEYPFCVTCWNFCYRCNCSPMPHSSLLFCSKCRSEHSYCPFHDKYCCSVKNHGINYDPFRDPFNLIDLTIHQHKKII